ncbi:hypothetical protein AcW1_008706 [Taiwanofungus camphoratus]|nr:hypothetical protein AcV5_006727 [Antrodia cinnamomea]KAI0948982.1 hypothetical protein AcW1_008706 [Antrodia cinnamomea]
MAPSHLQGLNIVHQAPPPNAYLSDADLLSVPPFPDLSAQLDLWTNLNFQSDEPLAPCQRESAKDSRGDAEGHKAADGSEDDLDRYNDQEDDMQTRGGIAETNAHENVVTGTVLPPTGVAHGGGNNASLPVNASGMSIPLDINSLLAGFGMDPFLVPPMQATPQASNANSLAQLLSLHASTFRTPMNNAPAAQAPIPSPIQPQQQQHQQSPAVSVPAPKRARPNRSSVSSVEQSPVESNPSPEAEDRSSVTPLNAAEDKRRRNTAASARFRLKKKEREAALERKAKELEVRVGELEKECEALRRENGWLKGLVVGVTGAGAVQQQAGTGAVTAGTKRNRDDAEAQVVEN